MSLALWIVHYVLRISVLCSLCYVFVFAFSQSTCTELTITFCCKHSRKHNESKVTMIILQGSCNVISLNVRGLRNRVKRRRIFCFLKDQKCDVYFLQETYSEPTGENIWRSEWGGDIFFSHGSLHGRGVCILLNPSLNCTFENIHEGQFGRIISIDLNFNSSFFV